MKRRDLIRLGDEEVRAFLEGRHTMNVATINHDGSIHLVAMWYGFADGKPVFWTYAKSQKILNLQRDPRVTCLVESGDTYDELQGVELVGKGRVVTDRDEVMAIGREVYQRYFGPWSDEVAPVVEQMGAKRCGVVIDVERTVSWDHAKLAG